MDWRYSSINEDFIKKYGEESDEECFLEVDVQLLEKLHEVHHDLPLLSEIVKWTLICSFLVIHFLD